MKTFAQFKKEAFRNKEIKRAYDEMKPEFEVVALFIERRIQKGLTQNELARRVGTKQSAISRFESGSYNPSLDFLYKVARGLDADIKISVASHI